MDYDIINQVIGEIITIVNRYNKKHGYDVYLMEDLAVVLLGYYLVFGVEIFNDIDVILQNLEIHSDLDYLEYKDILKEIYPLMFTYKDECVLEPSVAFDYKYRKDGKFIGAVPHILLPRSCRRDGVFNLIHELSHVLEGVHADILEENREDLIFRAGFSTYNINKHNNFGPITNYGFTELITSYIESRIINALKQLDTSKINNPHFEWFIKTQLQVDSREVITGSYLNHEMLFKSLFDNEVFWNMIKKYYYKGEIELLHDEFDSYSKVKLGDLVGIANNFDLDDMLDGVKYMNILHEKIKIFNDATGYETEKKILLLI